MEAPIYQVDSFTDTPFRGNPAAVCLLESWPEDAWLAGVGAEMNLSETAFVVPKNTGGYPAEFDLRWFTPTVEVGLCGHATLAAASVLWRSGRVDPRSPLRFHSRSGPLEAVLRDDLDEIALDFPAIPHRKAALPDRVRDAFPITPIFVARVRREDIGEDTYLLVVENGRTVHELRPSLHALRSPDQPCVIVTAPGDADGIDFISRFFAGPVGIDEDPVTGAAHCVLAPYWCDRLGRDRLVGYQASARGGTVGVERTEGGRRVRLRGRAVIVLEGTLRT